MSDALFINGTVFDGARFLPSGTEVRLSGTRITDVGVHLGAHGADIVDLAGGTLLPGFIDAHVHPVFAGNQLRHCDLTDAQTTESCLKAIADYAAAHHELTWITGGGWSMESFVGGTPTRQMLDAVVPDRPVYLPNRDGHGVWVNSVALTLAGVDRDTPDPHDGRIERDSNGAPSGTLQDGAADLVGRLIPEVSPQEWYQSLLLAQDYLLSLGITGWQDAIVGDYLEGVDPLNAYLQAAGDGSLRATVVGALWWERERGLDQIPELLERRRLGQAERFHANAVKMMLDGVAETHTAAMLEPYLDHDGCASDQRGIDFIDPDELPRFVAALDAEGFQVHFHALGDRAVRNALDAVSAARRSHPDSGLRHHLAHLQVVHPDDIGRFAALNATANIQALWAAHEPQMDELTIPFLGERRASWQYPFASLKAAGASLCAGSDWPVSSPDPLAAVHVAVNRAAPARPGEHPTKPFLPEQALGLDVALAAYTSGSARVNGVDAVAGSIKPGLDADLAVTDADLAHITPTDIGYATVQQTWVRGDLAYVDA